MKLECVCCSWGAQVLERLVMLEFMGLYLLVQELLMKLRSTVTAITCRQRLCSNQRYAGAVYM